MTVYKAISETTDLKALVSIIREPEPRRENGFKTTFSSHLEDALWYFDHTDKDDFDKIKEFSLKICTFYKK